MANAANLRFMGSTTCLAQLPEFHKNAKENEEGKRRIKEENTTDKKIRPGRRFRISSLVTT